MADWSLLPKDILEQILGHFTILLHIVQLRSVCKSWRSVVPRPDDSCSLGGKFRLPFNTFQLLQSDDHFTLRKIPIFLFRFETPFGWDYLISEMDQTKHGKPILMKSPLSCNGISPRRHKMLFNSLTSHIIPLGYYYEIKFYQMISFLLHSGAKWKKFSQRVELLHFDTEGRRHCMMLWGDQSNLMMFRSRDMSWTHIVGYPTAYYSYQDMLAFKGNFYVVDSSGWGKVFVVNPSLEVAEIPPVITSYHKSSQESLMKSGEDLLLVQRFTPNDECMYTWFRVFKLDGDETRRKWVQVDELKEQVIFFGFCKNLCIPLCFLPAGVKGNCIVFIKPEDVILEGYINGKESILIYDLEMRKTSTALSQCRDYMGAFGLNLEALVSGGIVSMQNPSISIYDI